MFENLPFSNQASSRPDRNGRLGAFWRIRLEKRSGVQDFQAAYRIIHRWNSQQKEETGMNDAQLREELLSKEVVFQGAIVRLEHWQVKLPNGKQALREVACHIGAAAVVAVDGDGQVILVRQMRIAVDRLTREVGVSHLPGDDARLLQRADPSLSGHGAGAAGLAPGRGRVCRHAAHAAARGGGEGDVRRDAGWQDLHGHPDGGAPPGSLSDGWV